MRTTAFEYPTGSTPLEPEEITELIPIHITTQSQLNEWEAANILDAEIWGFKKKYTKILEINFCKELHKKMFGETWKWAGHFRRTNKNIGVLWEQVSIELKKLFDDTQYQITNESYSFDEIATRFHHRLVLIHPFPNGNGRHARLMTDILLFNYGLKKFSWGSENLISNSETRKKYIYSLRLADKGNYKSLIHFVRL